MPQVEERRYCDGWSGTRKCAYQQWPHRTFPVDTFVFSPDGHFGLEGGGGGAGGAPPLLLRCTAILILPCPHPIKMITSVLYCPPPPPALSPRPPGGRRQGGSRRRSVKFNCEKLQKNCGAATKPPEASTGPSLTGKKKTVFQNQFSQNSPRALHVLNHGWWRLAVGGWRLAVGSWQLATGGWWRLVVGDWWRLAVVGGWRLVAAGGWQRLVVGGWWRLAVGGPLGRSLRAVLSKKKKIWSLKDRPEPQGATALHRGHTGHQHPREGGQAKGSCGKVAENCGITGNCENCQIAKSCGPPAPPPPLCQGCQASAHEQRAHQQPLGVVRPHSPKCWCCSAVP